MSVEHGRNPETGKAIRDRRYRIRDNYARFYIGCEVVAEMEEKCRRIARLQGVSLKTAFVYDGELAPSVEVDGGFDAIVSASSLLGM